MRVVIQILNFTESLTEIVRNHCFHDVQHHLRIITDGIESRKSNMFAHQIKNIDFWVWTQSSISDLV